MPIHIESPAIQTYIFIGIFLIVLILSFRKPNNKFVFDINITNELKGLAILMVIFSHMGYFLVDNNRFLYPFSVAGGVGVNLFFFLSGYGLSISALHKGLSVTNFYKNKGLKLFIPVWIILLIFLLLDFIRLNRTYSLNEIWHSFLGYFPVADLTLNINSPLWFITPIIIYYLLFPLIFNKKYLYISGIFLIIFSYILLFSNQIDLFLVSNKILSIDVLNLYKIHFLAFPLGLITADIVANKNITKKVWFFLKKKFERRKKISFLIQIVSLFFALFIISYSAIYSSVGEDKLKEQIISLITCFSIIFVFVFKNIKIGLLSVFGIYSYEIYLIHWPVLSRFDIFFNRFPPFLAVCLYLILFLGLGFILQKTTNFIQDKYN